MSTESRLAEATTALESARKLAEEKRLVFRHYMERGMDPNLVDLGHEAAWQYAEAADAEATAQQEFDDAALALYAEQSAFSIPEAKAVLGLKEKSHGR